MPQLPPCYAFDMRFNFFRVGASVVALLTIILIITFAFFAFHSILTRVQGPGLFPTPSPIASPSPAVSALVLTEPDFQSANPRSLPQGATLTVSLTDSFPVPGSSTIWSTSSDSPSVLSPLVQSNPSPAPGIGDLPYSATFRAASAGTSVLHAHATRSCEAMLKSACPDWDYSISITVIAA